MLKPVLLVFAIILLLVQPAYMALADAAAEIIPTDDDSTDALVMASSSIINGESEVPLNPTIQLNFNRNVVNLSVMFTNSDCFIILDSEESTVPIHVIFPDDQVQTTYRNQIFITPQQPLKPHSIYSLIINNTLQARNGEYIDNARVLVFSTSDTFTDEVNPILARLGDDIVSFDTATEPTEASVPVQVSTEAATTETAPDPESYGTLIAVIIVATAAVILIAAICMIRLRKQAISS